MKGNEMTLRPSAHVTRVMKKNNLMRRETRALEHAARLLLLAQRNSHFVGEPRHRSPVRVCHEAHPVLETILPFPVVCGSSDVPRDTCCPRSHREAPSPNFFL